MTAVCPGAFPEVYSPAFDLGIASRNAQKPILSGLHYEYRWANAHELPDGVILDQTLGRMNKILSYSAVYLHIYLDCK